MFELNGQSFTLEQVRQAAEESNMSLQEYIEKAGLTRVLDEEGQGETPFVGFMSPPVIS